ncbi:hypothetical protein OED52_18880 [Rhodococcus sp. Z13]|uniref:Uncharacterized protein n=1 Tax=Rhodococcus sacchari TaxID=2962047 RepID=A0ACD4DFB3_9NOCA|nr:hypothetical protein [Rhodococcus sp. Z13]UYP18676.1 hypothetical protein OED52_18880 [Rhodococcus sp. Z13]
MTGDRQSVILEWRDGPPSPATDALFEAAREADAEMDFSSPARALARQAPWCRTAEVRTVLHRWAMSRPSEARLAAVVVVWRVGPARWVADIVVDPRFRSVGLATTVFEQIGTTPSGGLLADVREGGELVGCAFGAHPAAERLARRFGAVLTGRRDRLVLPSQSAYRDSRIAAGADVPFSARPVDPPAVTPARTLWDDFETAGATDRWLEIGPGAGYVLIGWGGGTPGGAGRIRDIVPVTGSRRTEPADPSMLVRAGVEWLWRQGATSIEASVDVSDIGALDVFRSAAFQHDRSDLLFAGASLSF